MSDSNNDTIKDFLSSLIAQKKEAKIYLVNGTLLKGKIIEHDDISLVLDSDVLVFFTSIISIKN